MRTYTKMIFAAFMLYCLMSVVACNPNTGKNVGGCGTWDEAKKGADTTKVDKGI
ncbi:MAG: hypothetical protein U0X41_12665 [Chitinophagales bacterium]